MAAGSNTAPSTKDRLVLRRSRGHPSRAAQQHRIRATHLIDQRSGFILSSERFLPPSFRFTSVYTCYCICRVVAETIVRDQEEPPDGSKNVRNMRLCRTGNFWKAARPSALRMRPGMRAVGMRLLQAGPLLRGLRLPAGLIGAARDQGSLSAPADAIGAIILGSPFSAALDTDTSPEH